ncbi:hypothetical protein [Bordetella muralis]|jgi:hypothetical protein|uniref:hypothetical protein n=1 Tax=Bordetella muralis TaxID=1649130 RepID=UPI0039F01862
MKARPRRSIYRGQAAVEAMLALVLLGGLMHAVVAIGTVSLRGQQTAQLSRLAAFIHTDKHTFVPSNGDIGNAQVETLARDWLHVDSRLRRAQATDHSVTLLPFTAAEGIAIPAIHRQMVIAADTGHGVDDAAVSERIRHSAIGWSEAARGSASIADALRRRMQHVDAPWGREAWSMDWLTAWIDLAPVQAGAVRRDDLTEH